MQTAKVKLCYLVQVVTLVVAAHGQIAPNNAGNVQYGLAGLSSDPTGYLAPWEAAHMQLSIGGTNRWSLGANWNSGYTESAQDYFDSIYSFVILPAMANGWPYENLMLHYIQDYNSPNPWNQAPMDEFDVFEMTGCPGAGSGSNCGVSNYARAYHGAWIYNRSTYMDVTVSISSHHTGGCGSACTIPDGGWLYFGYGEPFDRITITLHTAQIGGSVSMQYWNGTTWANLATAPISGTTQVFTDGTSGLTTSGEISFYPPKDWSTTQVASVGHNKYWGRIGQTGASTAPVISTIAGDNWAATTTTCTNCGAGANVRGWDATDSDGNHVNVGNTCGASGTAACGNLEYDPNPPATATAACNYQPCSAKFRQQSRATGYGNQPGPAVYGNVGWQIGGHYTWATIKAWEAQDNGNQFKFGWPTVTNSVMFDDAGFQVRATPAPSAATTDGYAVPWITSAIGEFTELASILHGTGTYGLGPSFVVGTNPGGPGSTRICFVPGIAWCLREFTPVIYRITGTDYISEDFRGCSDPNAGIGMRDFLTTKCNAGTPPVKGFYEFEDDAQFGLTLNKGFHFYHRWDNMRSETLALAYFLMGYNPNVAMGLWSGTNGQTDYAVYWNPIPGTLSVALQWDCNQTAHRINVAGYSGFTHVGGDDGSEAGYYVFRIGGPGGDIVRATGSGGVYTTTTPYGSAIVGNTPNIQPLCNGTGSYPVGTTVEFAQAFRQSDPASPTPPAFLRAWHYASFPALLTAIGVPDTVGGWQPPGLNKGDGDLAYINACQSTTRGVCATGCSTYPCAANKSSNLLGIVSSSSTGISNCYNRSVNVYGCNSVGRRSFTNAEVYFAGIHPNFYEADIDVPGVTIPLGTMLYPLLPDGTTGPGVTSINLRAGEGFIGMRSPIP